MEEKILPNPGAYKGGAINPFVSKKAKRQWIEVEIEKQSKGLWTEGKYDKGRHGRDFYSYFMRFE